MEYLVWNAFLELGRLDVSSKEYFMPGMAAPWLPDVYYFGPTTTTTMAKTTPIRYANQTNPQELVGGIACMYYVLPITLANLLFQLYHSRVSYWVFDLFPSLQTYSFLFTLP
jgi:hypothetical protein